MVIEVSRRHLLPGLIEHESYANFGFNNLCQVDLTYLHWDSGSKLFVMLPVFVSLGQRCDRMFWVSSSPRVGLSATDNDENVNVVSSVTCPINLTHSVQVLHHFGNSRFGEFRME